MLKDLSQSGESKWICDYLVARRIMVEPFIVDVGAGDGEYISNSRYVLQSFGYKGLMIEMNPVPFKALKRLYKDSENVECLQAAVAGKKYGYVAYDASETHWSLSTLKKSKSKKSKETMLLSEIFEEREIEEVGILSIDVEGLDTEILAELLKSSKVRPEIVIVEGNSPEEQAKQKDLLLEEYELLKVFKGVNQAFILKSSSK